MLYIVGFVYTRPTLVPFPTPPATSHFGLFIRCNCIKYAGIWGTQCKATQKFCFPIYKKHLQKLNAEILSANKVSIVLLFPDSIAKEYALEHLKLESTCHL